MHEYQPGRETGSCHSLEAVQPLSGRERRCEVVAVNYSPTVNREKEREEV